MLSKLCVGCWARQDHYLGNSFTLKRFKDAFIAPEILDHLSYEQWRVQGSKDMAQRCREKAKAIIASYEQPSLDPAVRKTRCIHGETTGGDFAKPS